MKPSIVFSVYLSDFCASDMIEKKDEQTHHRCVSNKSNYSPRTLQRALKFMERSPGFENYFSFFMLFVLCMSEFYFLEFDV